jgi:hypothetical protein
VLLQEYCVYLSEFFDKNATAESYERFCLAILKLGKSNKEKLTQALDLGKIDYRDLLVAAGFGNSLTIHNECGDERILGDSAFVNATLSQTEESLNRHYAHKAQGIDLQYLATKAAEIFQIERDEIYSPGRQHRIVSA